MDSSSKEVVEQTPFDHAQWLWCADWCKKKD